MSYRNADLHGNAPDKCSIALLIIDAINDLEWEGGDQILEAATSMAHAIARLKVRCREVGIPVIYVNDNFGKWKSNFQSVVNHVIDDNTRGKQIAELLRPQKEDYFVLKPKHSGFFASTLETLLKYLGVTTVVLTGLQTDICVLFTANDAYVRDLKILAPYDCSASETKLDHDYAMKQLSTILKADTTLSHKIDFQKILKAS